MVLFLVVLEVGLVSDVLLLDLSDFLDLVVVDVKHLSIEGLLIKLLLGKSSIIWVLEANKSVDGFSVLREDLDAFDISILSKVFFEFLFSSVGWEVLDVEIASLL